MAISLADIKRSTLGPPRVVLYGVPGIGKTTEASFAPSPIFLPVEDGLGQLDVATLPQPQSYADVVESINLLLREQHDYETLVVDSLDKLEPLIWQQTCDTVLTEKGKKVERIDEYGWQQGYKHTLREWKTLMDGFDALRAKGMIVHLIAHSTIEKVSPPDMDDYDRYQMHIHKHAEAAVCNWADAVLFYRDEVVTVSAGAKGNERKRGINRGGRICYTTERAAWRAKNRYQLPAEIKVNEPGDIWRTLLEAISPATPTEKTDV